MVVGFWDTKGVEVTQAAIVMNATHESRPQIFEEAASRSPATVSFVEGLHPGHPQKAVPPLR